MHSKPIVAGLIGAGHIGKMHAENIIFNFPDVLLKAVAGPNLDENWIETMGIPEHFLDENVVIHDSEIEAVVIAAPSPAHVALIKSSAKNGKHIFCEKPVAFEPEGVAEAIEAVEAAGVLFQVGFNRRFDPNFTRVREIVQSGKIGKTHVIRITNRDPKRPTAAYASRSGGLFFDFCIHDFDMVRYISGCEVEKVYSAGAALIDPEFEKLGDIDTALITLQMTDGSLCIIDVSRETNYGYDQQLEVFGSEGSIRALNTTPTSTILSTAEGVFTDKPHYSFVERYKEAYVTELREFFSSIRNQTTPPVTGQDALQAVKIAQAAELSFKKNRPVKVER
ncbi:MAG: inositol 2-dehydrogenase [Candidatus Marinimicrobia bacterium]|nr:inositol 2-dehydrogenase [Candidatus Neomarinimicrobiota bacterium]